MKHRDDTETQSYREEQGKKPEPDPREGMADVPIVPSSAGVIGKAPEPESTTVDEDRAAAETRSDEE